LGPFLFSAQKISRERRNDYGHKKGDEEDPANNANAEMFAVLMMQSPVSRLAYRWLMRELVYQALIR